MQLRRGHGRYRSSHGGVETRHAFSAGAHYDPANLSIGALIGVDEHRLAPAARFEPHAHRGVEIVSYVLDGTLRHQSDGVVRLVPRDQLQLQIAGTGIEHIEANASAEHPLTLLQLTFRGADDALPRYVGPDELRLPLTLAAARLDVLRPPATVPGPCYLHLLRGIAEIEGRRLGPGDAVRSQTEIHLTGAGRCLCVRLIG